MRREARWERLCCYAGRSGQPRAPRGRLVGSRVRRLSLRDPGERTERAIRRPGGERSPDRERAGRRRRGTTRGKAATREVSIGQGPATRGDAKGGVGMDGGRNIGRVRVRNKAVGRDGHPAALAAGRRRRWRTTQGWLTRRTTPLARAPRKFQTRQPRRCFPAVMQTC